MNVTVTDLAN